MKNFFTWLDNKEKKYDNHYLVAIAGISASVTMIVFYFILLSKGLIHLHL